MDALMMILGLVVAYLIGSFSAAVWLGKWFYGIDVRTQGSGNAGATNTLRVLGTVPGVVVLFVDAFKGWLSVSLAPFFMSESLFFQYGELYQIALAIVVVLGHVFPIYTSFKGGKGVATLLGVCTVLYPIQTILLLIVVFLVVFIATRYVSLGSMIVAVLLPIISHWLFVTSETKQILAIVIALLVLFTHKKNIVRLWKGNESKIVFRGKKRSEDN